MLIMNYILKNIGKRLKEERKASGFKSQDALAEYLAKNNYRSFKRQTIAKWENGEECPPLDVLLTLCKLYKCELGYLLCEYDCKEKENTDIQKITGLSEDAINKLKIFRSLNDEPTLFIINEILSKHERLLDAITDFIFFPDNVQTDYHLETKTGRIVPKENFVFPISNSGFTMSIANQNIPLNSDTLRNALLNCIQENLILFKRNYIVEKKVDNKQKTTIKAPDTN